MADLMQQARELLAAEFPPSDPRRSALIRGGTALDLQYGLALRAIAAALCASPECPEGFVLVPVGYKSVFRDSCWKCYPATCRCPLPESDVEAMKGEVFLLDRELQRQRQRCRCITDELTQLAEAVIAARRARLDAGGEDNLPLDMFDLASKAEAAMLAARPQGVSHG